MVFMALFSVRSNIIQFKGVLRGLKTEERMKISFLKTIKTIKKTKNKDGLAWLGLAS